MTEQHVEPREIELDVGETIYLGDYALTILDVDDERIFVRVDGGDRVTSRDSEPFEFAFE